MTVLSFLRADLDRQFRLAGSTESANTLHILVRFLHPRLLPLIIIRASHALQTRRVSLFAQLIAYLNILLFGVDVATKCEIGPGLFLPHTSGTVIGASRIGENVTIYQNVTLGAKYADMTWSVDKRPTVGDNAILGAGCKVLGAVHIGANSIVGANSVVLGDVAENSVVAGIPACVVKMRGTEHDEEEVG